MEKLVLELQLKRQELRLGTGFEATDAQKRWEKRKMTQLNSAVSNLRDVEGQPAGQDAPPPYSGEWVDALLREVPPRFPWSKPGDMGPDAPLQARLIHYGRLLHRAAANVARCLEEEAILRVEALRLVRWVAHRRQQAEAACAALFARRDPAVPWTCAVTAEDPVKACMLDDVEFGRYFSLQKHILMLNEMGAAAQGMSIPLPDAESELRRKGCTWPPGYLGRSVLAHL